ncbi:MAG: helix-turn-helix domain-containing protein [Candidatus Paceibacterota bacterium]|jgi:excisionase family DNA binding protein
MANYKSEWMTIKDAAKVLNCSPEDIEMLIKVTMVADIRNNGGKLVNPKEIRNFLKRVQVIASQLLSPLKAEPKIKEAVDLIIGKEAAEKLGIPYNVFKRMCREGEIKAKPRGRGYLVEKKVIDEFILSKDGAKTPSIQEKAGTGLLPKPPSQKSPDSPPDRDISIIVPPEDPPDDEDFQPSEDYKPEVLPKSGRNSYSIRAREKNGGCYCRLDEVCEGLHMEEARIKKWIIDKQVKVIKEIERTKTILYIEKESLRTFLEKNDIMVNFNETH